MDAVGSFVVLLSCGIVAYRLMKWLWPIVEQRKDLKPEEIVERILNAPAEDARRQATRFGSKKKTFVVIVLNAVLLCTWLWGTQRVPSLLWLGMLYLAVGFVVQVLVKVPSVSELSALKIIDRIWLRSFHAWFWPAYVPYIIGRR